MNYSNDEERQRLLDHIQRNGAYLERKEIDVFGCSIPLMIGVGDEA